jgi:hypothetical protein
MPMPMPMPEPLAPGAPGLGCADAASANAANKIATKRVRDGFMIDFLAANRCHEA